MTNAVIRNTIDFAFHNALKLVLNYKIFRSSLIRISGQPDRPADFRLRKKEALRNIPIHWIVSGPMDNYRSSAAALEKKEPETLDWIDRWIRPEDVFFDIGANIGAYSLYAASKHQCSVYAFEPEAYNFATLNQNILANYLSDRVITYNFAVSDKVILDFIHCIYAESGQSGNFISGARDSGRVEGSKRRQGCFYISLDELVYRFGIPCPTHIKVDADGAEKHVMEGAGRLLADKRLKTVMCEIENDSLHIEHISGLLFRNGFNLENHKFVQEKIQNERHSSVNHLFVRGR